LTVGLADGGFLERLIGDNEFRHWQALSEALLSNECLDVGLALQPTGGAAPDLLFEHDGRKVWIEIVCPEPAGIPEEWRQSKVGQVVDYPYKQILLRWTGAIKEKAEKLLGDPGTKKPGYLDKGVVGEHDAYVIAVNGHLLSGGSGYLNGISGFPFAAEACFPIGPFAIRLDRATRERRGSGHVHQPFVLNANDSEVSTDRFLDDRLNRISAIWAYDFSGLPGIGHKESAVIYNPTAINPIAPALLPAFLDYVPTEIGDGGFDLRCAQGRLTAV
jgi:type I restriction enzyme S subunit